MKCVATLSFQLFSSLAYPVTVWFIHVTHANKHWCVRHHFEKGTKRATFLVTVILYARMDTTDCLGHTLSMKDCVWKLIHHAVRGKRCRSTNRWRVSIKCCHPSQCCQVENEEFYRMFGGILAPYERIYLGNKPPSENFTRAYGKPLVAKRW